MVGYIVAGAMGLAVIVGLVIVLTSSGSGGDDPAGSSCDEAAVQLNSGSTNEIADDCREGTPPPEIATGDLEAAAKEANCELQLDLPDEGNTHIGSDPAKAPEYETTPATSGNHIDPPFQQADGAYTETPDQAFVVHSMEHGRVAIQYSSDLPEEDQLALKGVFDESPEGVVLFPNDDMPYQVAVTAWTQMVGCETDEGDATLDVVRDFRDIYRGQGPEDVPLVTG